MKKHISVVLCIAIAVVAFGAGVAADMIRSSASAQQGQSSYPSARRSGFTGGRQSGNGESFLTGDVVSRDAQSIMLKLPDGSSAVVFYSSSTAMTKPSPASAQDVAPGTRIIVSGAKNADGSVTAQTIQVRSGGNQPAQQ